jgi:hypothetical protein
MSIHGYQKYNPKGYSRSVIMAAKKILAEYKAWESPMTVRQVFYRLVAEYSYDKTENAYGSLIGYIARSRRAYQRRVIDLLEEGRFDTFAEAAREAIHEHTLIPFSWIRDERGKSHEVTSFETVDEFSETVDTWVDQIQKDRQADQPRVIELWCEAAGMVPLMRSIAEPYGIRVSSGGGYDSVTAKHRLATRVTKRAQNERTPTVVLHVGDFDPSGEGMFDTLEADVGEMVWQLSGRDFVSFNRIALTEEQVIDMKVETAPPKPMDSRRRGFVAAHPRIREQLGTDDITAQLEALTPPQLVELIEGAIESYVDEEALDQVKLAEETLREEIRERLNL